jgi:predicted ArsR family transcriptional regulator
VSVVCAACGRPLPPPLPDLPAELLDRLDRVGPTSARKLADALHRRDADVRAALHELADAGVVRLEQPTRSPRSRRWAATAEARGRAWDAHENGGEGVAAVSSVLGGLAALVASDGLGRLLGLAAAALFVAAVVLGSRRGAE